MGCRGWRETDTIIVSYVHFSLATRVFTIDESLALWRSAISSCTYSGVMILDSFISCSVGANEWPSNQTGADNKAEDMPTLSPPQSPDVAVALTESSRVKGAVTSSSLPPQPTRASDVPPLTTTITQTKPLASVLPSIINMLNSPIKHSVALPTNSPKSVVSPLSSGAVLTPATVYPSSTLATKHHIPCLTDGDSDHRDPPTLTRQRSIAPSVWSVHDVCHFLCLNECDSYCDSFRKKVGHSLAMYVARGQWTCLGGS